MIHIFNAIRCTHQAIELIKHREESISRDPRGVIARTNFLFIASIFAFDALASSLQFGGDAAFTVVREAEVAERVGLLCVFFFTPKNEQNKRAVSLSLLSMCAHVSSLAFPQFKAVYYALSLIDAAYRSYRIAKEIKNIT